MKLNMNDKVRVRLTPLGRTTYLAYYTKYNVRYRRAAQERIKNNVLDVQLWELFEVFGPETSIGMDIFFVDNEIELVVH